MLSPKNQDILNKAKSTLGCDSPSTCKVLCSQESNMDKCKSFFASAGLKIEESGKKGPGGCTSPESCQAYCSDKSHADECDSFGPDPEGKSTRKKDAIKACENLGPDECKAYCEQNPNDCPGFWAEGGYKGPDYQSGEEYCEKNPGACPGPGAGSQSQPGSPVVRGISTAQNLIQIIIELIKNIKI